VQHATEFNQVIHTLVLLSVNPCFSIYNSSQNPKRAIELNKEPLPFHSKST